LAWYIIGAILGLLVVFGLIWTHCERGKLLHPSTRRLFREGGWKRFLNLKSLHGYIYLRWTTRYIAMCVQVIAPLFKTRAVNWLAARYHGKVITHELAREIILVNQEVPLVDLEQIIPYPSARNLVLNGPPDIVVTECPCRSFRDNPCQPTQVCMIIGQPFVNFKLEHSPEKSRLINREEALMLLEEEHQRGHVHSAWFRDVTLDRFIAICNCCKCCCGGIEGMMKYGSPMMVASGYVSQVDESSCTSCGLCVGICPFEAISIIDEHAVIAWSKCLGCGICTTQCPNKALSLIRDEKKGIPLDVRWLSGQKTTKI
jgi:Pyruvate/2-oxoacid:ferredoxin oxidoreductase delta subunit